MSKRYLQRIFVMGYKCSKCGCDCKMDEFSCYECDTCIDCGGCECEPMQENEEGFMDNDYGQQF